MRSVRLADDLERRIQRAASLDSVTVSEFVRRAVAERADRVLGEEVSSRERLRDSIGVAHGRGGRARRTGKAFSEEIAARRRR